MLLNIDVEIGIIEKYHLDFNELNIIKIFNLLKEDGIDTYLQRFINIPNNNLREILLSLQEKGIILKSCKIPNKGESFDPYSIEFNKTFLKGFIKASYDLGNELYEEYPMFTTINGNVVGIRTVSKKYDSLEDAFLAYGKNISWNVEKHNHIIELVKWAKDNNILNCSLASFIIDRRWDYLEAMKNGDNCNMNFDAIKFI